MKKEKARWASRLLGQRRWGAGQRVLGLSEAQRFLLLSIITGIFAGLLVVCFHIAIEYLNWNSIHSPDATTWSILFWPPLGAGIAAFFVTRYFPTARGSGVNATKAAIYVSDGYVPTNSVSGKFIASTLSIGSGNPMGPEDPALQMGAGVASILGRFFNITRDHMRMIAPVGAAAGIGAAFNTPITAVLFVMEEVLAAWNAGVLGSIVLSAVSAVVVSRWFLGDDPLFRVPEFVITHPSELLVYALMGVVGGVLSAYYVRYVAKLRGGILALSRRRRLTLPVLAGLMVGAVGVWYPQILGAGYRTIDSALHEGFPWEVLLILGALKMITSATCFSVGVPGGMFAPTLFIGAMIGGGLGALAQIYWPTPTTSTGAYVLAGMGTFFAGLFRAPMTSVFMVFEVSANYVIILPVMIANTISFLVSRQLQQEPLFHLVAHQDGLDLPSVEEARESPGLTVEEAMNRGKERVFPSNTPAAEALEQMKERDLRVCLVADGWGRWRWLDRAELEKAAAKDHGRQSLSAVVRTETLERIYPDQSLDSALRLLSQAPILPVSNRANSNLLLGTLTLEDVHNAYGISARAWVPKT